MKKKKCESLCDLELSKELLARTLKAYPREMDKLDFVKSENICSENYAGKRKKRNLWTEKKYLQSEYSTKDSYPKYTELFHSSIVRKQPD